MPLSAVHGVLSISLKCVKVWQARTEVKKRICLVATNEEGAFHPQMFSLAQGHVHSNLLGLFANYAEVMQIVYYA